MFLGDYLERNGIKKTRFAEKIGVTHESVRRYVSGKRFPKRDILARIEEATTGAVTYDDFREQHAKDEESD